MRETWLWSDLSTVVHSVSVWGVDECHWPAAPGMILSGYRSVRNRLLIRVDFPKPDSPENKTHTVWLVTSTTEHTSGLVPHSAPLCFTSEPLTPSITHFLPNSPACSFTSLPLLLHLHLLFPLTHSQTSSAPPLNPSPNQILPFFVISHFFSLLFLL